MVMSIWVNFPFHCSIYPHVTFSIVNARFLFLVGKKERKRIAWFLRSDAESLEHDGIEGNVSTVLYLGASTRMEWAGIRDRKWLRLKGKLRMCYYRDLWGALPFRWEE